MMFQSMVIVKHGVSSMLIIFNHTLLTLKYRHDIVKTIVIVSFNRYYKVLGL